MPKRIVNFCEATMSPQKDYICLEITSSVGSREEKRKLTKKLEEAFREEGYEINWVPIL